MMKIFIAIFSSANTVVWLGVLTNGHLTSGHPVNIFFVTALIIGAAIASTCAWLQIDT